MTALSLIHHLLLVRHHTASAIPARHLRAAHESMPWHMRKRSLRHCKWLSPDVPPGGLGWREDEARQTAALQPRAITDRAS